MKDLPWMLVPLLFSGIANVYQVYFVMFLRMLVTWLMLSLHYGLVDKDMTFEKVPQKQLERERESYLVGVVLHGYVQLALQIVFPAMFLADDDIRLVAKLTSYTVAIHIMLVEPLYYGVHRWLHCPTQFKSMHGFHHSSVKTVPSTSLVQNFHEHIIYVATFGPAMLLPYFILGYNHWLVIAGYLVVFDMLNAFGHTNIVCTHWLFHHPWSPFRYLLYTPAFHLGHHAYYNCNYALFMPLWDHLFGTYREYTQRQPSKIAPGRQDFVFIGHNGGLGHYLTIPEVCFYNIYDAYLQSGLPMEIEFLCADLINRILRCAFTSYRLTRYLIDGEHTGRVICLMRTPLDYLLPQHHDNINAEILQLIRTQHAAHGTRCFGLGNLNKMKQLNDGGIEIARMVAACPELQDKKIRIWTGDTLTVASIVHQLTDVAGVLKVLYIGAAGKVGTAVCQLLAMKGIQVCVYSTATHTPTQSNHHALLHTSRLEDLTSYTHVVIGKALAPAMRAKIQRLCDASEKRHLLLDYSVPFTPLRLQAQTSHRVGSKHVQIGVLKVRGDSFLQGYYDICMGLDQGHIYPCHAGCLLNLVTGRETDETGPIRLEDVEPLWIVANSCGLDNRELVL